MTKKPPLYVKVSPHGYVKNPAAVELGRLGGSKTSEKKTAAAKRNPKGHGRPKGAKDKQPRKRKKPSHE